MLRPRSGRSVLQASSQSTARALAARLERLILAAKRIPRTRLNPTVRQATTLEDWPAWLDAIRKELHMLREMGCYDEVRLEDVGINPKTGRRFQSFLPRWISV